MNTDDDNYEKKKTAQESQNMSTISNHQNSLTCRRKATNNGSTVLCSELKHWVQLTIEMSLRRVYPYLLVVPAASSKLEHELPKNLFKLNICNHINSLKRHI